MPHSFACHPLKFSLRVADWAFGLRWSLPTDETCNEVVPGAVEVLSACCSVLGKISSVSSSNHVFTHLPTNRYAAFGSLFSPRTSMSGFNHWKACSTPQQGATVDSTSHRGRLVTSFSRLGHDFICISCSPFVFLQRTTCDRQQQGQTKLSLIHSMCCTATTVLK